MELRNRYLVIFLKFYRVVTKSMFRSADENVKYGWIYQGGVEDLSRMKNSENQLYIIYIRRIRVLFVICLKIFFNSDPYFFFLFLLLLSPDIWYYFRNFYYLHALQYFNDSLRFFYSPWILFNISRFSLWIFDELFNNPFYHFHLVVN